MKVKLLSAIIAATFLAGCSSSGSDSSNEPVGVASVQTFDGEHFDGMAIQGDNGEVTTVAIRGEEGNTVFNVGGELYYTDGEVVKDSSGKVVGHIEVRNNELIFVSDDGFVHLSVEDGRLIVEEAKLNPVHPIEPTPEHPIAGSPSNPLEPIPEHPIADGPVNPIEITPENPIERRLNLQWSIGEELNAGTARRIETKGSIPITRATSGNKKSDSRPR
ncbi:hypothetical protein JCM19052_3270 [Vibrio sp. JCM 19052]|nr:hypothetical protein JCM19052_3270 [Vibrio sp. JCM 19052]